MAIKDYYRILNVKPDAPAGDIKKAYRKLALKYHPDRNPDDDLSAAVFGEIAEAYSVLGDYSTRKNYNNQRYHTAASEYEKPAATIDSLLKKAGDLENLIANADPFRFNHDALLYSIMQLFPKDVASLLNTNENQQTGFFKTIAACSKMLASFQTKKLMQILQPVFSKHNWLQNQLQLNMKRQLKKERWEKQKIIIAVIITLLLCIIIFFATKHS